MWRDMGREASWLCYDQVATSQIGREEKSGVFHILLSYVLVKLYTFLFKGIQTVGCRVQKQAMRLSSRTTTWSTSILLKYVSNWPVWHQHLFFYVWGWGQRSRSRPYQVLKLLPKVLSAINWLKMLVVIKVLFGPKCPRFSQQVPKSPVSQLQNGVSTSSLPPFVVYLLTFKVYPRSNSFF